MPDYTGQMVFVAFDGDHLGRDIGRASLNNDVDALRRLSQGIDVGNRCWGSWALSCGGTVVSMGGDEGRLEVPASSLGDLQSLRRQYEDATGATCSVGVGTELGDADKALLYAKLHGGDRVCFYTQDMDEELHDAAERQAHRSEVSKLADEYLGKGDVLKFPGNHTPVPALERKRSATVTPLGPRIIARQQEQAIASRHRAQATIDEPFNILGQDPGLQAEARRRVQAEARRRDVAAKEQKLRMGPVRFKSGDPVQCSHATHEDGDCGFPWRGVVTGYEPNIPLERAGIISTANDVHHYTVKWETAPGRWSEGLHSQDELVPRDPQAPFLGKGDGEGFAAPGQAQPPAMQAGSGSTGVQARQQLAAAAAQRLDAPSTGLSPAEECLHDAAQRQQKQDTATAAVQQQASGQEQLRAAVVKVLKQVKAAAPVLEQARQDAPEVYAAVTAAVQAMTAMAQQLFAGGVQPQQGQDVKADNSAAMTKAEADRHKCAKCGSRNISFAEPLVGARLRPSPNGSIGGIGMCSDCGSNHIRRLKYHGPVRRRDDGEESAPVVATEEDENNKRGDDDLGKLELGKLPMPKPGTMHRELNLPVGSARDGRVKVRHSDGTSGWVEVRAGQVMSQDGHPVSARNPGGR